MEKPLKKLHCPRCKTNDIVEYEDTFECTKCLMEFEKKDLELYEDEDILSIREKLDIVEAFGGPNKAKKAFK